MGLSSDLRFRVDLYGPKPHINELGEDDLTYIKIKTVWADINVVSGAVRAAPDESEYAEVTHKIIVRDTAITRLTNDMYFMFNGQRYDVKYSYPHYKYRDRIEIYCKLVVE